MDHMIWAMDSMLLVIRVVQDDSSWCVEIVLVENFTGGFGICTELAMMQLVSIDVHKRQNVWAEPFGVVKGG